MEGFVLLAIVIGGLAATALPVVSFCIGLSVALAVGLVIGLLLLPSPLAVLMGAVILFAAVQIGYALGLGFWAFIRHRRSKKGLDPAPASSKEPAHHPR